MFLTIQGEGPDAGLPVVMVRFAGCNLRCTWCDTPDSLPEYDVKDKKFLTVVSDNVEELHVNEVICRINQCMFSNDSGRCDSPAPSLVVITGGEPWLQPEAILEIHNAMIDQGTKVSIESNCEVNVLRAVGDAQMGFEAAYRHSNKLHCVFSPKLARIRAGKLTLEDVLSNMHVVDRGRSSLKIVVCNEEECYEAIALLQAVKRNIRASLPLSMIDRTWYGIQLEDSWLAKGWIANLGARMNFVFKLAQEGFRLNIQQHKVLHLD